MHPQTRCQRASTCASGPSRAGGASLRAGRGGAARGLFGRRRSAISRSDPFIGAADTGREPWRGTVLRARRGCALSGSGSSPDGKPGCGPGVVRGRQKARRCPRACRLSSRRGMPRGTTGSSGSARTSTCARFGPTATRCAIGALAAPGRLRGKQGRRACAGCSDVGAGSPGRSVLSATASRSRMWRFPDGMGPDTFAALDLRLARSPPVSPGTPTAR